MQSSRDTPLPQPGEPARPIGGLAESSAADPARPWSQGTSATVLLCVCLLTLTAIAFYPVVYNGFINLDDPAYVTLNTHVQQGLTWESFKWAFTSVEAANWHPVTWLSHLLDCQLFGEKVWGHHFTSLLLHSLSTMALFLVLRRLTGAPWRSFFVAALFGVHPLRVESVAWVAERKDVLSAFFFILTLWAYAWYARESTVHSPQSTVHGPQSITPPKHVEVAGAVLATEDQKSGIQNSRVLSYFVALFFFALGLMSKPMLVTLPLVLLLLDFWPLQRLGLKRCPWNFKPAVGVLLEKVPFLLLALMSCVVTLSAQRAGGIVVSSGGAALLERAANGVVSYVRYLGKLFWPANLAAFYPLPAHWPAGTVLAAAVLLLGVSVFALWMWRRGPYLAVGWFWFIGTLVPVIGLVQVGRQAMADRYTYLPSIGVFLLGVWGACVLAEQLSGASRPSERSRRRLAVRSILLAATGGALVLGCVVLTRHQLAYWKASETLFRRTLAVTGNNAPAHRTLGLALRLQGRLADSIAEMREAIRISPDYAEAYRDLGYDLAINGNLEEGIRALQEAVRLSPSLPRTHKQLGVVFQEQGRFAEALVQFQQELKITPGDAEAHYSLGAVQLGFGRLDEAISEFKTALRLNPAYAEAHSNLGIALCRKGDFAAGIAQFEQALTLRPNYAEAHNNLGVALARTGRRDEAIRHLNEALNLQPNYPGAEQQLRALTNAP